MQCPAGEIQVLKVSSNLAFERDAAKARRPSTLRWAPQTSIRAITIAKG